MLVLENSKRVDEKLTVSDINNCIDCKESLRQIEMPQNIFYGHSLPCIDSRKAVSGERMGTLFVNCLGSVELSCS